MRHKVPIAFVCLAALASIGAAPAKDAEYNRLLTAAYNKATAGQFDAAIADWQRAAAIYAHPSNRRQKCLVEGTRVKISAAQDTKRMLQRGAIRRDAALAWFNQRDTDLWIPNACNSN